MDRPPEHRHRPAHPARRRHRLRTFWWWLFAVLVVAVVVVAAAVLLSTAVSTPEALQALRTAS